MCAGCQSGSLARREGVGTIPCVSMLASSTTYSPRRSQTCTQRYVTEEVTEKILFLLFLSLTSSIEASIHG